MASKNHFKGLLLLSSTFALVSCQYSTNGSNSTGANSNSENSNPNSSVSTSDTSASTTATFSEVLSLLKTLSENEGALSSGATIEKHSTVNNVDTVTNEEYSVLPDGSGASSGSVQTIENEKVSASDTFKRRVTKQNDKIMVGTTPTTYPMYYAITDYAADSMASNLYRDSADKRYIIEKEADKGELTDSEYILASDYTAMATAHVAATTHDLIATNIVANEYVTQKNQTTFDYATQKDGSIQYSFKTAYSVDGDLNDTISYLIEARFTVDNDLSKLLSTYYDFNTADVNKNDKTDAYLDDEITSAVVHYDTRKEITGVLDVNDYFLSSISEIAITDTYDKELDPKGITLETSYLRAKAKTYLPEKATNLDLVNVSSSDNEVVALNTDGSLEVKKAGTTTLTFSYFGRNDAGVYEERTLTKDLVISAPKPTSIDFNFNSASPAILDATLYLGTTYTLETYVGPTTAIKTISVSNSDDKVLSVALGKDGKTLTLTPLAAGTSTITIASSVDPTIKTSKVFTVKAPLNDDAYLDKLSSTTYTYTAVSSTPTYTFTLTFAKDGTGKRIQHVNSSTPADYTDTFKFTLKGTAIAFSDWSSGAPHAYTTGTITENGSKLTLENDTVSDDYGVQA
jgi:hypothetical protein